MTKFKNLSYFIYLTYSYIYLSSCFHLIDINHKILIKIIKAHKYIY